MNELEHSAVDLQSQMKEKEVRIKSLLTTVDELIARDISENSTPKDSRRFYAAATYQEAHDNDRIGLLSFTKQPDIEPNSFLEITYNEHGFGDKYDETDKTYVLTRTNDGDIFVQVSDVISLDGFNSAITEAAEFGNQTEGTEPDPEMHAQAWDNLETNAHEVVTQEKNEATLSLKPATDDDLAKLQEILTIAKERTNWDQIDHHKEMSDIDTSDSPSRLSRMRKLAHQVSHFFAFHK